ncbi:ABC transporter permease [Streptomyces albiaxialis]|uniref:ABC transporter permease n=1 Tax=Streptomyces albiaxialis TaxID=329523 RepID=A0ABN2VJ82_9ACTN
MNGAWGVAVADFRDRVRRPAYLVILLAAVGLGYLAVPDTESHWAILQIGPFRGRYTSAYVGFATSLAGALWLALGGFYVVRGPVTRDEAGGVGRLLAATPLRGLTYFAGKLLSNVLVLASMLGVLAVTALAMQLLRGESYAVRPGELLLPFVVIALPLAVVTGAAALLMEAVPGLRGGLGNVVWFFVWMVLVLGGQGALGTDVAADSMREALRGEDVRGGEFSLGFTYVEKPLSPFDWGGFTPDTGFLLGRAALMAGAVACALLPALWFTRFDPARARAKEAAAEGTGTRGRREESRVAWSAPPSGLPVTPARTGGPALPRLLGGELRVLVRGVSPWWWAGAALISLTALAATGSGATRVVLPMAWVWPVVLWSRLGTQAREHGVEALLGAAPRPARRVCAEWAAGVALTAVLGLGPLVVLVRDGEGHGVASWAAGALFVPALALALGTVSRTHRLFQAVYLPLWYVVVNGMPPLDYMGATRAPGEPALVPPALVAALAVALLAVAVCSAGVVARRRSSAPSSVTV